MDSPQRIKDRRQRASLLRGFSLLEVMMVTFISAFVFAGVLSAYIFLGRGLMRQGNEEQLESRSRQLIAKFEGPGSSYAFAKLPESYTNGLIAGVIGFEMQIELLEGKFKLGQERSDADKQAMLKNLESAKPGRSIAEFTAEFYKRKLSAG